ncbi:MAG: hypothetical protein K2H64_04815 [Desulfovibrio sp.]|nr:hypothetical protein [Desulfovibrio sp.]
MAIPAARMKMEGEHIARLPTRVVRLLRELITITETMNMFFRLIQKRNSI